MNELEQLKKENAELVAKLGNLAGSKSCACCNNSGAFDYDDGFGGICTSACHCTNNPCSTYSVINISKIQTLADIKADAVIEMSQYEMTVARLHDGTKRSFVFASDIHNYANKLRGESK